VSVVERVVSRVERTRGLYLVTLVALDELAQHLVDAASRHGAGHDEAALATTG
jgi:hypothetical protein